MTRNGRISTAPPLVVSPVVYSVTTDTASVPSTPPCGGGGGGTPNGAGASTGGARGVCRGVGDSGGRDAPVLLVYSPSSLVRDPVSPSGTQGPFPSRVPVGRATTQGQTRDGCVRPLEPDRNLER